MTKFLSFILVGLLLLIGQASAEHFSHMVQADNTKLFVEVKGKDINKPLLLFLHGGPGDVELGLLPFQDKVGHQLEQHFLVAYLHQRGAGQSPSADKSTMTAIQHVKDVHHVVRFLKQKYQQQKVVLVGHSWGGALAALYAVQHPETVEQLVFIATFQDAQQQMQSSYETTLAWAQVANNQAAIDELTQYKANSKQGKNDWFTLAKWASQANGGIIQNFNFPEFVAQHKLDENYPNWQQRRQQIALSMKHEFEQINVANSVSELAIPALFIAGKQDSITTAKMMKLNYQDYSGKKAFVTLDKSHHLPFIDQPEKLATTIIDFLKS